MEQNNIKVSIIVPVYNCQDYLTKCLESIKNQTLKEIEIICINDGSTDDSLSILENFARSDERFVIINQKNAGQGNARNNGINIAKGEYIGFVDSDDWVDSDYFEKLYLAAKKYNSDISAGDYYRHGKFIKSSGKMRYKKEEFFTDPVQKVQNASIPKYNYIWNKIYKRNALLALNCPIPEGVYFEDISWLVKIVYNLHGFVTVPNTFYHYKKNEGSTVTQKSNKHKEDYLRAEEEMHKFMKEHNIPVLNHKLCTKEKIKMFGFKVMQVDSYYPSTTKYKLFGFINFIEVEHVNDDRAIKS